MIEPITDYTEAIKLDPKSARACTDRDLAYFAKLPISPSRSSSILVRIRAHINETRRREGEPKFGEKTGTEVSDRCRT